MDSKYKILEEKKNEFIIVNEKNEFEKNLKKIHNYYNKFLIDPNYTFLNKEIEQIKKLIKNNGNRNDIEKSFERINDKLFKIKTIEEQKNTEENLKVNFTKYSKHAEILFIFSKLNSIIEEFKTIKIKTIFLNRVIKFQKLIRKHYPEIDILSAYKNKIFSECEKESFVSQEMIDIFQHIANAYLLSDIVKNNLQNEFEEYVNKILRIDKKTINEIHAIFNKEEYIYFPKLILKDILYCFRYGEGEEENYKNGILNPTKKTEFNIDENEELSREDYINLLKKSLGKIIKNHSDIVNDYLEKINIFYEKMENKEYNINENWLFKSLEELKDDALKYPNRIIIKNKLENEESFEIKKFIGKKRIISKLFFCLLEGNSQIKTIFGENSILDNIINKIRN